MYAVSDNIAAADAQLLSLRLGWLEFFLEFYFVKLFVKELATFLFTCSAIALSWRRNGSFELELLFLRCNPATEKVADIDKMRLQFLIFLSCFSSHLFS